MSEEEKTPSSIDIDFMPKRASAGFGIRAFIILYVVDPGRPD